MMTVYILNNTLNTAGVALEYKSLIWNNRYWNVGDFELALPPTVENLAMCKKGYYVIRTDDEMVGVIEKVEIDTAYDGENLLIVSGRDVTSIFSRRVMFGYQTAGNNTTVQDYIAWQITHSCITPDNYTQAGEPPTIGLVENRKEKKYDGTQLIAVDTYPDFTESCAVEKMWGNLGETIQELCQAVGYGFKMLLQSGMLRFRLYKGFDRSNTVFFTPEYDNLSSTKYITDSTNFKNVAYIIGSGKESGLQHIAVYDLSNQNFPIKSVDRYEMLIDAKSVERIYTVADMGTMFPNWRLSPAGHSLIAPNVVIQIYTPSQEAFLTTEYSGTVTEVNGNRFFNFTADARVADLLENSSTADSRVALAEYIYDEQLYAYAVNTLAERKMLTSFEGSVIPNVTYQYRRDYALGDIVTVRNKLGIEAQARIVEALEVFDENGYSIEPRFEYLSG